MARTEAYQAGREAAASGKGGNPWGGSFDHERWDDYEQGKEDQTQEDMEKEAND